MSQVHGADRGVTIPAQNIYEESSTAKQRLGTRLVLGDRVFRYAKAGAALTAGYLNQGKATDTQFATMAVPAAVAAGGREVALTNGTTAIAAHDFDEGWLYVDTTPGQGQCYRIKSHTTALSGAAVTFTLYDDLVVALTTASKVSVLPDKYMGVLTTVASNVTAAPVGVSLIGVTSGYYAWLQVKGPCAVLTSGTLVIGQKAGVSATAGAVGPVAADTTITVGKVLKVNATTLHSLIDLELE